MQVIFIGKWLPGYIKLCHPLPNLSQEAKLRLKWMDYYRNHANNASLTCRYFVFPERPSTNGSKGTIDTI